MDVAYTLQFFFSSKEAAEAAPLIEEALRNREVFGLMPKSKRNVVIFSVQHLRSWWMVESGSISASHTYATEKQFVEAISIQLLSHKTFVKMPEQGQARIELAKKLANSIQNK